jgi:protein-S-isoprenylcysteine O-methyltransferase
MYWSNSLYFPFITISFIWAVAEAWLLFREPRVELIGNKKNCIVLYCHLFSAIIASLLLSYYNPLAIPINQDIRLTIGILIICMGLTVRWWAINILGKYFRIFVIVQAHQKIIKVGPYKYIRHPSYTGSLLIFFGLGISLGNWIGLVVMIVLPFIMYFSRVIKEERVLLTSFGKDYLIYKRQTTRFIPFVF